MAVFKCTGALRATEEGAPFCTYEAPRPWKGRCPSCGRLYNIKKVGIDGVQKGRATLATLSDGKPKPRVKTNIEPVDKVLNGGIPKGSTLMISGPPGVGKTTLLLNVADQAAEGKKIVTYASGEQSVDDIADFAKRLNVTNPNVVVLGNEGDIYKITEECERNGSILLVVDSLQTCFCEDVKSDEGSSAQCKAVANYLTAWGKREGVAVFLVSHVNKEGDLAGPKAAEHLVDGTLEFDPAPDMDDDGNIIEKTINWRRLTSGTKFRIGPSNVSELFEMTSEGIEPVTRRSKLIRLRED